MNIRIATTADRTAWDAYVDTHPDAVPYSYFSWMEAVEDAYGHRNCSLLAEKNGTIRGVLPLIHFRIPFLHDRLVSLPFCDIGNLLADNHAVQNALACAAIRLAQDSQAGLLELRSNTGELFPNETALNMRVHTDKVRMLLHLPASADEHWDAFKSKLRSQIRKAGKNGLVFSWGNQGTLDAFFHVFSRNMRDLGSPVHSKRWIEKILTHYGTRARMGLVYHDDHPVGCGIILFTQHTVSIPWASTLQEYNHMAPNMMLYWNLLKFAVDNRKKKFDFGRCTVHEGTYRFKKQWGAEPEQLYWYSLRKTPCKGIPAGTYRKRIERTWQKLPLALANILGPGIRKYISL